RFPVKTDGSIVKKIITMTPRMMRPTFSYRRRVLKLVAIAAGRSVRTTNESGGLTGEDWQYHVGPVPPLQTGEDESPEVPSLKPISSILRLRWICTIGVSQARRIATVLR